MKQIIKPFITHPIDRIVMTLLLVTVIFLCGPGVGAETLDERIRNISREEMQSVMEFLGHDLLEGRSPGTRGGNLAEIYAKSLFKWMNLAPGHQGKYLQPFTLRGSTLETLDIQAGPTQLKYPDDVVGTWVGQEGPFELEADAVFLGFGITAKPWDWDDYKDVNVENKLVIVRVNDPGMYDDSIFEGKTLTYYGRWIYHIEEAARRGAAGILMIHTDASAGYGWHVVQNSWSGEEVFLPEDLQNNLKFRGWIKEYSLRIMLESRLINLDHLYERSLRRNFKAFPLGLKVKIKGSSRQRDVLNHNVVAVIPGKSPKKIVLSAHLDHLGMAESGEDRVYNGAIDNGSAVAAMMVTARILKQFQKTLHYTVVVLACQAEEAGLLGSKYFARRAAAEGDVIAAINFESTPVWGKTSDFIAIGARFSTLEDMLKPLVEKAGMTYAYSSMANQGFFYRSDQYSFARFNIPAIWITAGEQDASNRREYQRFWSQRYHTVKDEYDPQWPLDGMKQTIDISLRLIRHMNQTRTEPRWKGTLTFPITK